MKRTEQVTYFVSVASRLASLYPKDDLRFLRVAKTLVISTLGLTVQTAKIFMDMVLGLNVAIRLLESDASAKWDDTGRSLAVDLRKMLNGLQIE